MKYSGIFASSTDPEQLSQTVRGVIIAASVAIVFVGHLLFKIDIDTNDITVLATQMGVLAAAVLSVYGLFLKYINAFHREA